MCLCSCVLPYLVFTAKSIVALPTEGNLTPDQFALNCALYGYTCHC